ncbi:MAG: hypothetical protein V5B30_12580 [Candidatus Accumulibacter delftensis]
MISASLKTRLESLTDLQQESQRQEDVVLQEDALSIAREANKLSRRANKQFWLSLVALFISLFALLQSHEANRPNVHIKELPPMVWSVKQGDETTYYGLLRIVISNTGGRNVTLNTLSKQTNSGLILGVYENGKTKDISKSFGIYYFDESAKDQYDILSNFADKGRYIGLAAGEYFLGKMIEAGDTYPLYLAISSPHMNFDALSLIVNLEAHFSDKSIIPISAQLETKPKRTSR